MEEELINLIFYVHAKAELVFQHADKTASVKLGRGLRQGCGLSPLLWVLYTVPIVEDILQRTPSDCIAAFADDFHGQWVFRNPGSCKLASAKSSTLCGLCVTMVWTSVLRKPSF